MVVQLTPDQITAMWNELAKGVRDTLPPIAGRHEMAIANVLTGLMNGSMQMWAGYKGEEAEGKPDALALTTIIVDPVTFTRKLLIYGLVRFSMIDQALFQEGLEELKIFAGYHKCFAITAYTQQPNIVSLAEKLGADISWTYIHMEV